MVRPSRLRKNGDRHSTPSPDPREAARSGAEGLPLSPRELASQAIVQGEERIFLGVGGAKLRPPPRPPTPCEAARSVAEGLSAMGLRILASQSAERG